MCTLYTYRFWPRVCNRRVANLATTSDAARVHRHRHSTSMDGRTHSEVCFLKSYFYRSQILVQITKETATEDRHHPSIWHVTYEISRVKQIVTALFSNSKGLKKMFVYFCILWCRIYLARRSPEWNGGELMTINKWTRTSNRPASFKSLGANNLPVKYPSIQWQL